MREFDLQDGIETVLRQQGVPFKRETQISRSDRPDFIVDGGIALEVKVKGGQVEVLRQLHRYAQQPSVRAILLVTTRNAHRGIPRELNGKPTKILLLETAF